MPREVRPDIEAILSRVATAAPIPPDPLVTAAPAAELVAALSAAGQTVATAESLTAGWPLRTRDAVAIDTFARRATSLRPGGPDDDASRLVFSLVTPRFPVAFLRHHEGY